MRRTDRLYALVEELRLRAPRPVGRSQLARQLEVTPRTVERDILALQEAGVPIWSQRGKGGGYAIDRGWSLPPLNFDASEALAVIAALTAARSMPFAAAGRRAERKLLAAMTAGEAARTKEVAGRLRVGSFGAPSAHDIVEVTERAVLGRRVVRLKYRDRDGRVTARAVEAHGLQLSTNGSYLLGWCRMREAPRAFRLDRIVFIKETGETAPERDVDDLLDGIDEVIRPDVTEGGSMPAKPSRNRRPGPPRKADHRTGANPAFARAVAAGLPEVDSTERRGVASFATGGHGFMTVDDFDDSITLTTPDSETITFVLRTIGRDEVRDHIVGAWEDHASKRAVTTYRKGQARRQRESPVTSDDIRRIVRSLPGATEGPIWGQEPGFLIGTEKRTRFARFGPPEGARVGNLLPPDDEDSLVILNCDHRPDLIAASPDRFFTTPHYGGPGEPGGVITRLIENRGPADLAELAELLEESWRAVATPELIDQLDRQRRRPPRRP